MTEIQLSLQSARDALRDCAEKLESALQAIDRLQDEGQDSPIPTGDIERLHSQCRASLRTLEKWIR